MNDIVGKNGLVSSRLGFQLILRLPVLDTSLPIQKKDGTTKDSTVGNDFYRSREKSLTCPNEGYTPGCRLDK